MRMVALVLALFAGTALAQQPGDRIEVVLDDGSVLYGSVIDASRVEIRLSHRVLGELTIDRRRIETFTVLEAAEFEEAAHRAGWRIDPDYNSIMLSPTTETLAPGDRYFRNFELFILNFGAGVSDDLNVSVGALFPITGDFNMIAAGFKYRLVSRESESFPIGLSATANAGWLDDYGFGSVAAIAGVGDKHRSLNASVHASVRSEEDWTNTFMLGADTQVGPGTKVVAEFTSGLATFFGEDEEDEIDGFINVGFRWFGEANSFTLTGLRPVGIDTGSFIAFPLAMYSRHF